MRLPGDRNLVQAGVEALCDAQQAVGYYGIAMVLAAAAGVDEDKLASLIALHEGRVGEGILGEGQEFLASDARPLHLPPPADHAAAAIGQDLRAWGHGAALLALRRQCHIRCHILSNRVHEG